jgi:hypothetical protein
VATRDGIFAAARFLRHAGIEVTAAHYADKKTRTVIDMAALLSSGSPMPENIEAGQGKAQFAAETQPRKAH